MLSQQQCEINTSSKLLMLNLSIGADILNYNILIFDKLVAANMTRTWLHCGMLLDVTLSYKLYKSVLSWILCWVNNIVKQTLRQKYRRYGLSIGAGIWNCNTLVAVNMTRTWLHVGYC